MAAPATPTRIAGAAGGSGGVRQREDEAIVAAAAVPEPSTWAMLAAGFACSGLAGSSAARRARGQGGGAWAPTGLAAPGDGEDAVPPTVAEGRRLAGLFRGRTPAEA